MSEQVRKWIITLLVFWGLFQIMYYLLVNIVTEYIIFREPFNNVFQIVGLGLIVLLSLLLTSVLVHPKDSSS
ncbi:hypothetical protein B9T62_24480 [Paenibacillus donghaensis]|uniref:Uncharacterized protein n=2 Tax=Paenibacillus donghaensis TaxID=414771 RepID=A0A2Z2KK29_9BACL|nr:hypothetical protein B9T62_24480 [Paenibacillus donghaensis]